MAKLTKEEWVAARVKWESDTRDGFAWLAIELGISRPGVSKMASYQGWIKKKVTQVTHNKKVTQKLRNKVTQDGSNIDDSDIASKSDTVIQPVVKSNPWTEKLKAGQPKSGKTILKQTMKERAAEYGDDAITTLVDIMNDTEVQAQVRIAAADKLLDRGFGKPKQEMEVMGEINYVDKGELDARYAKNMERTMELARLAKDRIEELKNGALH